jgi:hypothetical protein
MDSSPSQKRPIGLTVGPLAFLFGLIAGLITFAVLNSFDGFQDGEPTPTPFGPILLDGEYAKLCLAFLAFMVPIVLSGMRNAWGPRPNANATIAHARPMMLRAATGNVTRDEFDRLSDRVRALEPKPTVEQVHAAVDAAFTAPAPQAPVVVQVVPATVAPT